jgi:hypothetical protein
MAAYLVHKTDVLHPETRELLIMAGDISSLEDFEAMAQTFGIDYADAYYAFGTTKENAQCVAQALLLKARP